MKPQVVSFHCHLKDRIGHVLGSTFNHDVINQSDQPSEAPLALVNALQRVKPGEKKTVFIRAEDAYGFYKPDLAIEVPRDEIPGGVKLRLGDEVPWQDSETGKRGMFRVVSTTPTSISLDGNHPLAGQDLIYDIEIVEARDASASDAEELPGPKAPYLH